MYSKYISCVVYIYTTDTFNKRIVNIYHTIDTFNTPIVNIYHTIDTFN